MSNYLIDIYNEIKIIPDNYYYYDFINYYDFIKKCNEKLIKYKKNELDVLKLNINDFKNLKFKIFITNNTKNLIISFLNEFGNFSNKDINKIKKYDIKDFCFLISDGTNIIIMEKDYMQNIPIKTISFYQIWYDYNLFIKIQKQNNTIPEGFNVGKE